MTYKLYICLLINLIVIYDHQNLRRIIYIFFFLFYQIYTEIKKNVLFILQNCKSNNARFYKPIFCYSIGLHSRLHVYSRSFDFICLIQSFYYMDPVTEIILYFAIDHYFNFINYCKSFTKNDFKTL